MRRSELAKYARALVGPRPELLLVQRDHGVGDLCEQVSVGYAIRHRHHVLDANVLQTTLSYGHVSDP